jgi:hypothetical protein
MFQTTATVHRSRRFAARRRAYPYRRWASQCGYGEWNMQQTERGVSARLMYYDDFTRSWRLKPHYELALWIFGGALVLAWIVAVW